MPCSSMRAAAICSASAIGASTPASLMCASMSRAWARRRLTSLLAFAGGISRIRELTSTGNGSESAKCSHGSPSGKAITSGNREKDRYAAYESPPPCSSWSSVRPLCTCPSKSPSISPAPQVRRLVADGGGSPREPIRACRSSHASSSEVACRAASALAARARPTRSAWSVHLVVSADPTASSSMPSLRSPLWYSEMNWDSTPPDSWARMPRWPSRTPR